MNQTLTVANAQAVPLEEVPVLGAPAFREALLGLLADDGRLAALLCLPSRRRLAAVVHRGKVRLCAAETEKSYPSLTPDIPAAHAFERDMYESAGLFPEGHPFLKPLRYPPGRFPVGQREFYRVEGNETHEVAVGPVHAGIIEPGHFRFQCHGERVLHLEISLGYQHRGVERSLTGGPRPLTPQVMETACGDSTMAHASAYALASESLGGVEAPPRAQALRAVGLELERLANHMGDLGALAGDAAFLPTASFAGRLRGDFLNMTALLCGSRFGRGLVRPGGVAFDVDGARADELIQRLNDAMSDAENAVNLLWNTPSVSARFEDTGVLTEEAARSLGVVGVAARASGLRRDVRAEFPSEPYGTHPVVMAVETAGDVMARACVRWVEMRRSADFVRRVMARLPSGPCEAGVGSAAASSVAVSLVEGWRGEVCHVAVTDAGGRFAAYKIIDPSVHNWMGLAWTMRDQPISDFPLCNKSFNLSYCGHDL